MNAELSGSRERWSHRSSSVAIVSEKGPDKPKGRGNDDRAFSLEKGLLCPQDQTQHDTEHIAVSNTLKKIINGNEYRAVTSSGLLTVADILCDGVGGGENGGIAAEIGILKFLTALISELSKMQNGGVNPEDIRSTILNAINEANKEVTAYANRTVLPDNKHAPSSTFVAHLGIAGRDFIVSVGDSVAYVLNEGGGERVNPAHSRIEPIQLSEYRGGDTPFSNIRRSPNNNAITSYLGCTRNNLDIEIFCEEVKISEGDMVVLGCDGIWEGVDLNKDGKLVRENEAIFVKEAAIDVDAGRGRLPALNGLFGRIMRGIIGKKFDGKPDDIARMLVKRGHEIAKDDATAIVRKYEGTSNNAQVTTVTQNAPRYTDIGDMVIAQQRAVIQEEASNNAPDYEKILEGDNVADELQKIGIDQRTAFQVAFILREYTNENEGIKWDKKGMLGMINRLIRGNVELGAALCKIYSIQMH